MTLKQEAQRRIHSILRYVNIYLYISLYIDTFQKVIYRIVSRHGCARDSRHASHSSPDVVYPSDDTYEQLGKKKCRRCCALEVKAYGCTYLLFFWKSEQARFSSATTLHLLCPPQEQTIDTLTSVEGTLQHCGLM